MRAPFLFYFVITHILYEFLYIFYTIFFFLNVVNPIQLDYDPQFFYLGYIS